MRSLIDIQDLTPAEIDELIATANDIIENPKKYSEVCHGKKLATLFFEPSTRTRLSFEAAMYELGGNVMSVSSGASSSAAKETAGSMERTISKTRHHTKARFVAVNIEGLLSKVPRLPHRRSAGQCFIGY